MSSKVLIVEDDVALCRLIKQFLSGADIEAHGTTDSAKASTRLQEEKFDAIIMDMRMPPPDGIELTRQVRAGGLNRTTPIVIITGEEEPGLMARAFQAGASLFLFKPFDRMKLLRLIRMVQNPIDLEKRRFRRIRVNRRVSMESGQHRLEGQTLDISLEGLLVQTTGVFPLGSVVKLSLDAPGEYAPIRLTAHVKRIVGRDCMGLQFKSLGEPEREKLQTFLLSLGLAISQESPLFESMPHK
jgi:CheY-like chemotaxis protein